MNRVEKRLLPVASRIWPELAALNEIDQHHAAFTLVMLAYAVPLAIGGMVWLALVSEVDAFAAHWPLMLVLFPFMIAFRRLSLFVTVELRPGMYGTTTSTVENIVGWSAALILGPTVLWLEVLADVLRAAWDWNRQAERLDQLHQARDVLYGLAQSTIPSLIGLTLYQRWGGTFPIGGVDLDALLPALYATVVTVLATTVLALPLTGMYLRITAAVADDPRPFKTVTRAMLLWFGLAYFTQPLATVMAGLYAESGPVIYLFMLASMLLANAIGSRLSLSAERNRQRTQELVRLEELGRAMLAAPLDGSTLPDLLRTFVPGMFSHSRVELCLFPGQTLVRHPEDWEGVDEAAWQYLRASPDVHRLPAGARVPWSRERMSRHTLLLPVVDMEGSRPLGGLFVSLRHGQHDIDGIVPAARSLAAQISSAMHAAKVYRETLAHQRTARDLEIAGSIQASFLPTTPPEIEGWEISAALVSARETSGDFFDLIPLWDGKLGVVIADVADKGIGAALYMALARTLLRTYIVEYSTRYPESYALHPERVLSTVNECILHDTNSDLFVTVFVGILDPQLSTLTYGNAGHNPPYLFCRHPKRGEAPLRALVNTGIPLGVLPERTWERGSIVFSPGDLLLMYTDGITEARSSPHDFYGDERLREVVRAHLDDSAQAVREAVLADVQRFMGDRPQSDDISLLVLKRQPPELEN